MPSRRRYLRRTAGLALLTTAGCLSDGGDEDDSTGGSDDSGGGVDGDVLVSASTGEESVDALGYDHVVGVGNVAQDGSTSTYTLSVGISDAGIDSLRSALASIGGLTDPDAVELSVYQEGEVLNTFPLASDLAESLEAEEFDGVMALSLASEEDARSLQSTLES